MRILIAPDKFKGSLSAAAAAQAIEVGMRQGLPQATFDLVPVADGGDGTAETIVAALGGQMRALEVSGPDAKPVTARYGVTRAENTAIIELAQASGLALVPPGTRFSAMAPGAHWRSGVVRSLPLRALTRPRSTNGLQA